MRWLFILLIPFLMGFQTHSFGNITEYFAEYKTDLPKGNTIHICKRDGCYAHKRYTYTKEDISDLKRLMQSTSPQDERNRIALSLQWWEAKMGRMPTDCTADAANVTSHLLILQRHRLIQHHQIIAPLGKWSFWKWPHFAGMIKDKNGTIWAVDIFLVPFGTKALIEPFQTWYMN